MKIIRNRHRIKAVSFKLKLIFQFEKSISIRCARFNTLTG